MRKNKITIMCSCGNKSFKPNFKFPKFYLFLDNKKDEIRLKCNKCFTERIAKLQDYKFIEVTDYAIK